MFQVQPLSQRDPRWKDNILGTDNTTTIGVYGCLLTCLTLAANTFGAKETPATLNNKMKTAGGFQGAMIIPSMLPNVVANLHYNGFQPCPNTPAPLSVIDAALAANQPVIVQVDYSPAPGLQSHWVILLDKNNNDYTIQDPWPYPPDAAPVSLTQRFGFAAEGPSSIIKAVVWLTGTLPQPLPVPQPIPTSGFTIYPTVDQLALRQQPLISADNLILRIPLQVKLYVVEDAAAAQVKIGQVGQWIQVIESQQGYPGYVAAWYVRAGDLPSPGPQPEPQPAPTPQPIPVPTPAPPPTPQPASTLILYAMADGLALRSQPVIGDATLLKREPLNTQLLVMEDAALALEKIGVMDEWIQVQDIEGSRGFAAAWYVAQSPSHALGVGPAPQALPASGKLVMRPTTDNLALRSQPFVADSTLIKRCPLASEFLALEPVGPALAKIGHIGQWLNVTTIDGLQGYVAAWYVSQRPAASQR